MTGKLKISGNILAAQKLQQLWSEESPKISVSEAIPSTKKISEPTSSDSDIEVNTLTKERLQYFNLLFNLLEHSMLWLKG